MSKLPYLTGLGFVYVDSPAQAAEREADGVLTRGLALAIDDDQAKALVRATTYGRSRYAQDVVRLGELRELGLVDERGLQTERGRKVARAIDFGARRAKP